MFCPPAGFLHFSFVHRGVDLASLRHRGLVTSSAGEANKSVDCRCRYQVSPFLILSLFLLLSSLNLILFPLLLSPLYPDMDVASSWRQDLITGAAGEANQSLVRRLWGFLRAHDNVPSFPLLFSRVCNLVPRCFVDTPKSTWPAHGAHPLCRQAVENPSKSSASRWSLPSWWPLC